MKTLIDKNTQYQKLGTSFFSGKKVEMIQFELPEDDHIGISSNVPLTVQWITLENLLHERKIYDTFKKAGEDTLDKINKEGLSNITPTEDDIFLFVYTPVYDMTFSELYRFCCFLAFMSYMSVARNVHYKEESVDNLLIDILHEYDLSTCLDVKSPWWIISERELEEYKKKNKK